MTACPCFADGYLTIAHVLFKNTEPKVENYYSSHFYPVTSIAKCVLTKKYMAFYRAHLLKKQTTQKQNGQSPDNLFVAFFPLFFVTWAKLKNKNL